MKNLSLQFLQEELKRVSDWIKFSDEKTAFLAVYYSALFVFAVSHKSEVISRLLSSEGWTLNFLCADLLLIIITFSFGTFFLFSSIFPRLKNTFTDNSLFYFEHVANMKFVDYLEEFNKLTDDEAKKQIIEQIYTNSLIADQKMRNIQKSTKLLLALIGFSLVLLFIN